MIENDGLALKLFKQQCCDNCEYAKEEIQFPQESIQDYIERLKGTVSSFTQNDFKLD